MRVALALGTSLICPSGVLVLRLVDKVPNFTLGLLWCETDAVENVSGHVIATRDVLALCGVLLPGGSACFVGIRDRLLVAAR